jgi:serine/threonine protein phosphatase 1
MQKNYDPFMNQRLFAIGDIHGCFDQFRIMVEERIKLRKGDRLVLLGDYIDRGLKIKEVIDYILDLKQNGFDVIPLIGNHESMMLDSVDNAVHLSGWFMNGGYDTLYSFGVESPDKLEEKYLHFFRSLLYYYIQDQFIFVHAGFNDEIADPLVDKYHMIWSRRETYSNPFFSKKVIIHGHTPIPSSVCREEVESGTRFINIDTGCVYDEEGGYGHLTAIEVFTRDIYSV